MITKQLSAIMHISYLSLLPSSSVFLETSVLTSCIFLAEIPISRRNNLANLLTDG